MPPRLPCTAPRIFRPSLRRIPCRTLIAAPKEGSGPLLTRRPDRELPNIPSRWRHLRTVPIFLLVLGASAAGIFNYQKSSSSVVSSTLYALRMSDEARNILGDEIYFANKVPWIWGTINQVQGRIDISYRVKGTRRSGMMRFVSARRERMGFFETSEWSLTLDDGTVVQLLMEDGPDPSAHTDDEEWEEQ
ncbi:DUF1783-domain-containing protein [Pseudovirgaria hyperparasitica]|uniref:DUF1783-domain-containing protein n=1 Tax=Pseudovirgaria hyperparasitica TaxID=470096 RepID=A0A6A6W9R1_9PEZI|nr:DUF1783-domain-containing protein [Pseudovirgaria hyperparasitica]KAF2759608.1 DUF1783-domain-containing protein [Pseudovirgaria hyperparasitica]